MTYNNPIIKYSPVSKVNWNFNEAPERLPAGDGLRITEEDTNPHLKTVLYSSKNGSYFVGPEILIRYAVWHKNNEDENHLNVRGYGETFSFDKYTQALRKFNEITGSNLQIEAMAKEDEKASKKALKTLAKTVGKDVQVSSSDSPKKRGRKMGELTVVNAKAYISMHKKTPLSPERLETIVSFLIDNNEEKFLQKHLGL